MLDDALLRLGERAARAEAALRFAAERLQGEALRPQEGGRSFDAGILRAAPQELLLRLVGAEVLRLSPQAALRLERLERASDRLRLALAAGATARLTLGGALIELRAGALTFAAAPARRAEKS